MAKRLLIAGTRIGTGEDELGRILMKNFLYSVARNENKPSAIFLINEGVRLACTGSDSLEDLGLLVRNGVAVRACGTCLDYLGLKESLAVGEVGTMPDLVASLLDEPEMVVLG